MARNKLELIKTILLAIIAVFIIVIFAIAIAIVVKVYQKNETKATSEGSQPSSESPTPSVPSPTPSVPSPTPSVPSTTTSTTTKPGGIVWPTNPPISPNDPRFNQFAQAASLLREMGNFTVDPCKDFYQFTCGAMTQLSSFSKAYNNSLYIMAEKITDPGYRNSNVPKPVKQLFEFYDTCVNALSDWDAVIDSGNYVKSKLSQFKDATNLPFPLLSQHLPDPPMPNATVLSKAIGYLDGALGTSTLISSFIDTNWKDPHSTQGYALYIDQSSLSLPLSYYIKAWDLYKEWYRKRMLFWMKYLQQGLNEAKLEADVDSMIALELDIAWNLSTDDATRRNYARSYNLYSTEKASQMYPFIDWPLYLNQIAINAPADVQMKMSKPDFEFLIMEPRMLTKLGEYLSTGKFKPRTIVNYLNYRIVDTFQSYMPHMSQAEQYKSILEFDVSAKKRRPRSIVMPRPDLKLLTRNDLRCASRSISAMQYANARMYIDAIFPSPNKREQFRQKFAAFMESVLIGFRSMIDQLSWMSFKSKRGAYNKIDDLTKNIAFPDFINNDSLLTKYYAELDIQAGESYTTMQEKLYKFNVYTSYAKLTAGQTKRNDFNGEPGTVNAWYQPEMNSITFPAGILQQPFYDPNWPASLNYGSMGVVVGHELTHGFDDEGVQWDGTGVLYQWMDEKSYTSFERMAQCVISEYGHFCPLPNSYKPRCLDGSNTQGENIADNGGIHAAYRAFKVHQNMNGPDPSFDDAIMRQFTPDQLFFMGFAQVWCETPPTDEDILQQILTDPHSPSLYRVFGTIQNFPAFRAAFKCPVDSAYSPENHCDVWVTPVEGSYGMPTQPSQRNELNIASAPEVSPAQMTEHKAFSESVSLFKASMNLTANPCDNFYEYVCGNYDELLSFRKGRLFNYHAMSQQMELPIYEQPQTPTALKKIIQFYKKCKTVRADFDHYISDGSVVTNALNAFAVRTGLKFSMVDSQSSQTAQSLDSRTLAKAVGYLSSQGIDTLISTLVDTNWTHPQHYSFFSDQNVLYYAKTYYTPVAWPSTHTSYKQNTIDLFNHYAALKKVSLDQNKLSSDVDALLDFERVLAQKYSTDDTTRRQYERSYNPYTVQNATETFGFIDFATYFEYLSSTYHELDAYFKVPDRLFLVMEPKMVLKLSNDFKNFDSNMVANYFFYRILAENSEYLPRPTGYVAKPIVSDQTILGRQRRGTTFKKAVTKALYDDPSVECAYETLNLMQYANARIFVDYSYPNDRAVARIRSQAGWMIENILLSMRDMLNRLNWMDDKSKDGAYEKISDLVKNIAFPDFIMNKTQLDAYYEKLVFNNGDTYFDMIKKADDFNFLLLYENLVSDATVDRHDFGGPPGTVNAWYYPEYNSITFPAGILHQPFFDEHWPASMNFGGLGVVAGHELTHGFDDEGVQWNGVGKLVDWMTPQSMAGFNKMAQCVVNEYNGFCPLRGTGKVPDCVNGEQTQGENIADNGGIHAAWRAYQDYVSQYGPDPQLPDPVFKAFTQDQLFFMAFAQVWCEKPRPLNAQYTQIMTDPHSPAKYRVFGTVQNFPAFRTAFNCPLGSSYAPRDHCSVWVPESPSTTPVIPTSSPPSPTVPHYTNAPISKDDPRAPQFAKAAELFRKMIDTTVDPCNDFYKFTCGKFDRSKTKMSFEEAELYNLIVMLLQFRDASHPHPKLPKPVQQVFYLYDKCLWATQNWKLATNNFTYTESKLKQYQQATGLPFPLLHQTEPDPAMPNRTLLAKAMGYLDGVFGTSSLISSFIDTNWKFPHSTQGYMLFIDQSSLTLPIPVYKKLWNEQYSDYFTNMTMGMFNMIRPGLDQAKLRTDVKAIYELEYTIAINVTTDEKTRRRFARSYNRYSLVEANAEFKFIDWSQYFNQLSTYADPDSQNKIRSNDFEFIIMEPSILHKLAEYIEKGKFTPRTIANYLYFRVAKHYEAYLPNGAQQRDETVEKIYDIFGKDDFDMRPKRREWRPIVGPLPRRNRRLLAGILDEAMCIGLVNSNLDYASGRIFIDALFPNPAQRNKFRQNFADFTESILDGFRSMLDELEWMDRSSKSGAFNKVRDLVKNIAYPNFLTDDALLSEHYASLELSKNDTFLTMLENIYEFNMRTEYAKLRAGPSQRNDFGNTPDVVNAWYQPEMNSITIPAGIIRYPFYNPMWPAAVNYGSMGVIIGHELTHGFDDHGVQWDGTGVLYQWMDNSTFKSFENMAQCVVDEYNGFCPFPSGRPKCLDGSNTQGENIADNGGIHAAYRAFKTYQNLNGPEPAFDDALMQQFTPDQLFFMSFAQVWCEKASSASGSAISILLDPHSPSKYRVFGTIQNFPAFRSAFSCPLNSEYAPKKHCDVWISPVKGTYGIPKAPKPENALNILPAPRISPAEEQKHKGYTEAVQLYKQSMNLSADPCNNFYDYVCGSYNQPLSFTKGRIANYRAMSYQMELPRYKEVDTPNALKKLIQFYDTCKSVRADFGAYIKDGEIVLNAIEDFKTRTQLKFSMIESQSTQSQQTINAEILGDAIGYLSSQGIDTLISAMVDTNWTHPQHYCFYIDQNVLYYSKTYYSPIAWPTTYPSYKSNTIDLFNHYAALKKIQLDQTTLAKDVEKLLDFERTLAQKYSTSDTERRHFMRSYNPYNKQNATEPFKFINLTSYFAGLSSTYPTVNKEYFSRSDLVFIVMEPQMIHKLSADFNTKFDSNTVANYLFYRILAQHRQYLPRPSGYKLREVEPHREHMPFLGRHAKRGQSLRTGITDAAYREPSVQCAYETLEILQYANARIFVDYSYPNEEAITRIRQQVGGIIENILMSFRGMLNRLEWMDQRTKRGAYEKITDLKQNIAFPDFILDNEQLDSYYADLHYAPDDKYYDMIKETDKFNFELIYKVLVDDSTVNRNDFGGPPGTVNAWYYSTYNSITFPAGILHQPFFDENWPASLNYGGLGLVAGHELTHGFDDQGVQWNGVGALTDWMTDASMQGFNSMAHCVVQEYDHFCPLKGTGKMPDCVNGEQTQGENIADNGGIHAAWRAYKDHISQYGPDPQLPDPLYGDFTNDQLYFMSFAQVWCETPRSIDAQYRQIMTDPHSPSRYRVFGTIQNFPGFREAFNCPLGSAYGPKEHCSVWVPKTGGQ